MANGVNTLIALEAMGALLRIVENAHSNGRDVTVEELLTAADVMQARIIEFQERLNRDRVT